MGNTSSSFGHTQNPNMPKETFPQPQPTFRPILDQFETLQEVQDALQQAGLESSQLIVGIDFTKSNEWTGKYSFNGKCLHFIDQEMNFYEQALYIIAKTLEPFDDDHLIPTYGFGDITTHAHGVFPFYPNDVPVNGLKNALIRYRQIAPHVQLSGPTSFAPLIHHAIKTVIDNGFQYHILVILADGQVTPNCLEETQKAIVAASNFPMSIIMIGIGDGPWDQMENFDDELPTRVFDNFQFVNFCKVMDQASVYGSNEEKIHAHFALHALMEIPDQYKEIVRRRLATKDSSWYRPNRTLLCSVPPSVLDADRNATTGFM
eukprot:g926.t1